MIVKFNTVGYLIGEGFRNTFKNKAPLIIVGGMAFINSNDVCKETDADYYCKTLEDIKALFNN